MDFSLACVQLTSRLGAVAENLESIRAATSRAVGEFGADFVLFGECATTGYPFGDEARALAEPADGATASVLADLAAEFGVHLAAGVIERDGDDVFDALSVFADDGTRLVTYRKVHLFSTERNIYTAGDRPVVVDTKLGRIGLTVCYDLIFPEFVRRLVDDGADVVVNATNWITDDWQTSQGWDGTTVRALARIRAFENGVPVAMACVAGSDEGGGDGDENGAGMDSLGWSTIAGSTGRLIGALQSGDGIVAGRIHADEDTRRWAALASYRADRRPEIYR